MIMITTKNKSVGDLLISPSSTSSLHSIKSTITSESRTVATANAISYSQKSNATTRRHNVRNGGGGGGSLRSRHTTIKHQRPPLNNTIKTNNLQREYKIRQSQTLLLLATTIISFLLFLLFTLPFYALVGLTMMTTFLGLGIVVATSALKTRYLLELEHPLGLLRYLPQKVRVPLTEKSLHDCLLSPSTSLNSLKSFDRGSSNNSSKNSLSSMLLNNNNNNKCNNNNSSNNSSMESLASYNNNKLNSSSSSSLNYPRRVSSRPSLLPPPPPPPPSDQCDDDDDDIKTNNNSEFSCSGFDLMRQSTLKSRNIKIMVNQEEDGCDDDERKREEEERGGLLKSDRYSIYQTNEQVIR